MARSPPPMPLWSVVAVEGKARALLAHASASKVARALESVASSLSASAILAASSSRVASGHLSA